MKESLSQYQHQKWVIGVSGGSDSMALLDLAYHSSIHCVVCHVNYQKRDSSIRDQKLVEAYCLKKNIPFHLFLSEPLKGNFQDAARVYRYQKMKSLVQDYQADAMVVAHHLDDDLETILFQQKRASLVDYYGLALETNLFNTKLLRPLLSFSKQVLLDYCLQQNISFGEDETNHSLAYTRNVLRKELDHLSSQKKKELLLLKEEYNQKKDEFLKDYHRLLRKKCFDLNEERHELMVYFLAEWLRQHRVHTHISLKFVEELYRQIHTSQRFDMIYGHKRLLMQYKKLYLLPKAVKHYTYKIETIQNMKTSVFELQFVDESEIQLTENDFPFLIKDAASMDDLSALNLNRWFIKHKIPLHHRERWPILVCGDNQRFCVDLKHHDDDGQVRKISVSMVK